MNQNMENRRVLVTGGSGFIGSHLLASLLDRGFFVTNLDLRPTSMRHDRLTDVRGDIRDEKIISQLIPGHCGVFHLAAWVSVPLCELHPQESRQVNVDGVGLVFRKMKQLREKMDLSQGSPFFIFSSSASVYGKVGDQVGRVRETDAPAPGLGSQISAYGYQKALAEKVLHDLSQEGSREGTGPIRTKIFRFFNVYGSGQDPKSPYSGVLTIFFERLRQNNPVLQIQGDGKQTRDFISVQDIVRGMLEGAFLSTDNTSGLLTVNLGTGIETSILDLARLAAETLGRKFKIEFLPPRQGDLMRSCADISLAQKVLEWTPQVDLHTGLKQLS